MLLQPFLLTRCPYGPTAVSWSVHNENRNRKLLRTVAKNRPLIYDLSINLFRNVVPVTYRPLKFENKTKFAKTINVLHSYKAEPWKCFHENHREHVTVCLWPPIDATPWSLWRLLCEDFSSPHVPIFTKSRTGAQDKICRKINSNNRPLGQDRHQVYLRYRWRQPFIVSNPPYSDDVWQACRDVRLNWHTPDSMIVAILSPVQAANIRVALDAVMVK